MRFPGRLLLALLVTMALPASTLLAGTEPARETPQAVAPAPALTPAPPVPRKPSTPAVPERPLALATIESVLTAPTLEAPPAPSALEAIPAVPASEKPPTPPAPEKPPTPPPAPPAPAETPRPPSSARAPRADSTGGATQLFQVAMVVGSSSPTTDLDDDGERDPARSAGLDDLPRSVRQALTDLGEFLPYKRYMLLDTVLIRTATRGVATMKGPGGREMRVELRFRPGMEERESELMITGFEVTDMTRFSSGSTAAGEPDGGKPRSETPSPQKTIIATSFGMSIGETLVVGSSRLNGGDTALILLVTAPR